MANQAAKKAEKASIHISSQLKLYVGVVNTLYILMLLVFYSRITLWTLVGYVFLLSVTFTCYSIIILSTREGSTSEYANDILIITLTTQCGLIFSNYFWFLYLVIPGFILFKGGKSLLNYVFTPDPQDRELDAAALKKQEKAERKNERMQKMARR